MTTETEKFESWVILELMGHVKVAGLASEAMIAGAPLLRVDVPDTDGQPGFTQFYGATAIYRLTPVSEEVACALAASLRVRAVQRYELPQLAAGKADREEDDEEDEDDDYSPADECTSKYNADRERL